VLCRWRCYIKHGEFHNVGHLFVGKWYMYDINILHKNLVSQTRYIYEWKNRIIIIQTNKCPQCYQNYNNIKKTKYCMFWALLAQHQVGVVQYNCVLHDDGLIGLKTSRSWFLYYFVILIKLCAFVVLNCYNWTIIHGMENVEFVNTQQAKQIYCLNNCFIQLCAPDDGAIRTKIF